MPAGSSGRGHMPTRQGGDAGTSTRAGGQELCVDGARRRGVLRGEANMGCSIRLNFPHFS